MVGLACVVLDPFSLFLLIFLCFYTPTKNVPHQILPADFYRQSISAKVSIQKTKSPGLISLNIANICHPRLVARRKMYSQTSTPDARHLSGKNQTF